MMKNDSDKYGEVVCKQEDSLVQNEDSNIETEKMVKMENS